MREKIGLAFQITDDILEVTSDKETLGKDINSDLKNDKCTYINVLGINKAIEKSIDNSNDIVIFDIVTSSLIHYCIEHEILFIFVVPRSSIEYYTSNQKYWFDVMRNQNLVFFNDEKGKMSEGLTKLIDSKAEMPIELKKYHDNKFII